MRAKQQLNTVLLSILFALCSMLLHAQPYAEQIAAFKKQDSASFPAKNGIVFIGSSSFTRWTDVQNYFPGKRIINRAFGGSTLPEVIMYVDEIVTPYSPKQVVIYCGENDLTDDKVTPVMALDRFKQLFTALRSKMPKVSIVYMGMKPSPSRRKIFGKVMVANGYIRDYMNEQHYAYFIDTYYPMLLKNGQPNGALFTEDSLHMNADGYKLWKYLMDPYILRAK